VRLDPKFVHVAGVDQKLALLTQRAQATRLTEGKRQQRIENERQANIPVNRLYRA
jgi:hypothetical protein